MTVSLIQVSEDVASLAANLRAEPIDLAEFIPHLEIKGEKGRSTVINSADLSMLKSFFLPGPEFERVKSPGIFRDIVRL